MYYAVEPLPALMEKARAAAREAVRLQPELAEARLSLGYVYYYVDSDYDGALRTMPKKVDPNGTITLTRYNYKMYERKFDEVLGILERSPAEKSRGETNAPIPRSFFGPLSMR